MKLNPLHPYKSVWYVPDQGMGYTILDTLGWKWFAGTGQEVNLVQMY